MEQQKSLRIYSPDILPSSWEGTRTLLKAFLAALDIKQASQETYRRQLEQFIKWAEENNGQAPDRETILRYKEYLKARELSALSISGYLTAVRKFFEWTETVKQYPNIARGIKGMKQPRGFRKDPLTVSQIKALLNSIPQGDLEGKRDYALLNLLINTALRTIEIERALIEDIRQEGGEAVLWIQGKGRDSKDEFVLLTDSVLRPLREYLNARGPQKETDPLFTTTGNRGKGKALTTRSIRRIVKTRLKGIDINNGRLTAHSLRHTGITLALQAGASIQEAQALGRHASINTTLIYAHNINRLQNAPERGIERLLTV